jgi:hypothetical protein
MKEIVINKCYGGFGLSHKAIIRYAELKGFKLFWKIDNIHKEIYKERAVVENPEVLVHYYKDENLKEYFSPDIERDDEDLIKIVREMGNSVNSKHSDLNIVEIPDGVEWEVEEYDGVEWIAEKHRVWG